MPKPGDIITLSATVEEAIHLQGDDYNLRLVSEEGTTVWMISNDLLAAGGSLTETEPIPVEAAPEEAEETQEAPQEEAPAVETEPTEDTPQASATGGF